MRPEMQLTMTERFLDEIFNDFMAISQDLDWAGLITELIINTADTTTSSSSSIVRGDHTFQINIQSQK